MRSGATTCRKCPIFGGIDHEVQSEEAAAHTLQKIEALAKSSSQSPQNQASQRHPSSQNDKAPTPLDSVDIVDQLAALNISKDSSPPKAAPPDALQPHAVEPDLADLLMAIVISDDPTPPQQASKLFSSRQEVQELGAPQIPDKFNSIPLRDARRSIAAVVRQPQVGVPATFETHVPRKETIGQDTLQNVRKEIESALQSLERPPEQTSDATAAWHDTLRTAAQKALFAGNSLQNLRRNRHLADLRSEVEKDLSGWEWYVVLSAAAFLQTLNHAIADIFSNPIAAASLEPVQYDASPQRMLSQTP
ncbi:hypothetical protein R3P38DRAFT_2764679 [Favolaschia claudopus]|uniref:Uncharacterized protein n=1 Tax=Favolaschia claudopus TaxID=2862362 RepID=A0AAW0DBN9_9AGAR